MKEILTTIIVLGATGFIFSVLLAFLSKKLKVEDDPRTEAILAVLPGLNCGACGFSGCRPYADAVVKTCQLFNGCLPGGGEVTKKMREILGVTGCVAAAPHVVVCRCGATGDEKKISATYHGPQTCASAQITGGVINCLAGCLSFGDCVTACPVAALTLENKKIIVDIHKCIGCGKCIKACPRNLFTLVPKEQPHGIYYVGCSNTEKALNVKKVCSHGCIGCGMCVRLPDSAYELQNNLSFLNQEKITTVDSVQAGHDKCPTKCIFKK